MLHVISAQCAARNLHNCTRATRAYVLETVRGAVRLLSLFFFIIIIIIIIIIFIIIIITNGTIVILHR